MRHMGNSGRIAIGAMLAALALLVLTAITLHETVFLWFLAASAVAYVACVAELVIRRRHRTLAASGLGSTLFIAFGIAFLRQWGLAFNPDPEALSTHVDSAHPDLYFYLAAAAGAATLLLLVAGTVLPGRGNSPRGARYASRRRPVSRGPASRGPARSATPRGTGSGKAAPRPGRPAAPAAKRPAPSSAAKPSAAKPVARTPVKPAAKSPARPAGRTTARR
ncbi:hypothetical protein E5206_00325 [Arthrobacter sp. PAMC25564]|uniref:hypothetical protein n=1 Tax=Arthrobacter sp. PAMC25564 TaxID=2565366 RepID=UPI0010A2760A|nr:hypothetical protein [Arthrobacter sp. PAMC25564]QCB95567.1 hypothetical protein E5206_00325 [Arthrobacter sp. PAMC25564]